VFISVLFDSVNMNRSSTDPGATEGVIVDRYKVHLQGKPLTLEGNLISPGHHLPDVTMLTPDINPQRLQELQGKWLIVSTVPSLDTPVCSAQAQKVNEHARANDAKLSWVVISEDLPFAQKRWRDEHNCGELLILSDAHSHSFAKQTGLWISELGVLARSVLLVDPEGAVREVILCSELSEEPNYQPILDALPSKKAQ